MLVDMLDGMDMKADDKIKVLKLVDDMLWTCFF